MVRNVVNARDVKVGASRTAWMALTVAAAAALAACGGGETSRGASQDGVAVVGMPQGAAEQRAGALAAAQQPTSREDAFRLLQQASFGPTESSINEVMARGPANWVDTQLAMAAGPAHLSRWRATNAAIKKTDPDASAGTLEVVSSIYQQALQGEDQLRQRTAYALSQIFVTSLNAVGNDRAETMADYYDMLTRNAFGNFRSLLQSVAVHPAMGLYLSHIKNRPENLATGRRPDQNFAREVMQLFSIGLYELNADGSYKLDEQGRPIETYASTDVEGMAAVFTGFSWGGPDQAPQRFSGAPGYVDPNRLAMPMQGYSQYHERAAKTVLGRTIPARDVADPNASLQSAMDTLFNHANVGPFISRQLIQRLVRSNPSPAYVQRISSVFADNGSGVRGDMKAVVRAILLDNEARNPTVASGPDYGKLKEPVLRLTSYLRAFNVTSDAGNVLMVTTDDAGRQLNQSPLRSPSVFNFYRPGYVPPGGEAAQSRATLPEMQITDESSTAGYANFMLTTIDSGVGQRGRDGLAARRDLQVDLSAEHAVADNAQALVNLIMPKLFPSPPSAALQAQVLDAVNSIGIPVNKPGMEARIAEAKRRRANTALLCFLVSPEYIVQK